MKITRVSIQNYRSIKHIEFELDRMLALAGPNNAGKSNILRAVDLLLNPSKTASDDGSDFYMKDTRNSITISATFSSLPSTVKNEFPKHVYQDAIIMSRQFKHISYSHKTTSKWLLSSPAKPEQKDEITDPNKILIIEQNLPKPIFLQSRMPPRGDPESFERKILPMFFENFPKLAESIKTKQGSFDHQLGGGEYKKIAKVLSENMPVQSKVSLGSSTLRLEDILRVKMHAGDSPDDVGSASDGMQRSIVFSALKSYADFSQQNAGLRQMMFLLEEPELYLHPQAQSAMYRMLQSLSDSCQIIYTTHSVKMVHMKNYGQIRIVRKPKEQTVITCTPKELLVKNRTLSFMLTSPDRFNQGFFAAKIVLVEGPSEEISLPIFARKLDPKFDQKNISIIASGTITAFIKLLEIYEEFDIPCYVIFDGGDSAKGARNALLMHFGVKPKNFPSIASYPQPKFTVFRGDYEKALQSQIPNYHNVVSGAGSASKPIRSAHLAEECAPPSIIKEIFSQVAKLPEML